MNFQVFSQVIAIGPAIGVLRSELFPTEIRATSAGVIMALGNLTSMVNLKLFPIAVESLGFHTVTYFYAAVIGGMVAWGFLTIKDNDRLSLTEIQEKQKKAEVPTLSGRVQEDYNVEMTRL